MKRELARLKKKMNHRVLSIVDKVSGKDYAIRYQLKMNGYHTPFFTFDKEKVAFVHVPKTGGTTVSKMLSQSQNQHNFINIDTHKPISIHCPPTEFQYVTIIRNPVDRVWSQYQMALRNPSYPYGKFAAKGLEYFVKNCWAVRNMYCQYYSGEVYREVNQKIYDKATTNLNHFQTIISFADFSNELSLFFNQNNIPFQKVLHERVAKYAKPDKDEINLIQTANQYDIALFEAWKKQKGSIKS